MVFFHHTSDIAITSSSIATTPHPIATTSNPIATTSMALGISKPLAIDYDSSFESENMEEDEDCDDVQHTILQILKELQMDRVSSSGRALC